MDIPKNQKAGNVVKGKNPRQRQDSENGRSPQGNSKGQSQPNRHPKNPSGHHLQNGYGNGLVKGNGYMHGHVAAGLIVNGNGQLLGNTNLGMLFNGLVQKVGGGRPQKGLVPSPNVPGPQPSPEELTMRLNTEALHRIDGSFKHLYGSASQVAVYDFDAATNYWTDTKTVGCLFLYSRSEKPEYGLVVLNRKGLKNLVMFFDKDSQVIPHEPYLLFRRGPNEAIKCIWFYKNSEFYGATELLKTMGVHFDHDEMNSCSDLNADDCGTASGLQIIDMLKKSQAKFDDNGTGKPFMITAEELEQQMLQDVQDKPQEPPKTPQGDANAHAGRLKSLELSESGAFLMKKFSLMPSKNPAVTRSDSEEKTRGSDGSISPRLNDSSRSMRTVEQLEKDLVPEISKLSSVTRKKESAKSTQDISNELLATLGIKPGKGIVGKGSASIIMDTDASGGSDYSPKSPFMTPASRSRSESGRSGRKLTIDDLDGKLYEDTDEDMVREVVESLADLTELLLLSENVVGQSEPQLVWRKRSNLQNRPASALIRLSQNVASRQTPHTQPESNCLTVSPLTRNQLLQAMNYLLQTDSDFVTKIHEAYVKSLEPTWRNKHLQSS